jgi:tetratricopeptide (TPR) repeat protein
MEQKQNTVAEVEPVSTSVVEVVETDESPYHDSSRLSQNFWYRLRRWLMPTPKELTEDYQNRLEALDLTVSRHPEAISNYVLRGELHLSAGIYDLAVMDFQRALELGSRQFETERWGVITQAMRDRAYDGLNRALRLRARERIHGEYSQDLYRR